MHADISRATFRPDRHYSAVIAQQGRVQLDADANEQTAIELARARTLAADLIGQHGGPSGATGFAVGFEGRGRELDDLSIGGGRYYVDGILLDATRPEPGTAVAGGAAAGDAGAGPLPPAATAPAGPAAPATWTYWDQPDGHRDPERPGDRLPGRFPYLVFLKVWERSVTAVEDPLLREVALGSAAPDTTARLKVVWQVLPLPGDRLGLEDGADKDRIRAAFADWAARQAATGRLAARSERPGHADDDPCPVGPDSRYRGPENQLYRVEIHEGGAAGEATYKWSRENGSVALAVDGLDGVWAELASPAGDDRLGLQVGDWVEWSDTASVSRGEALPLLRVEEVDLPGRRVRLSAEPHPSVGRRPELRPFLRRWDHRPGARPAGAGARGTVRLRRGALPVEEGGWLPLEDGVQVWFEPGGSYRPGDFWTVAARTATGDVEWPVDPARRPLLRSPHGIRVHYAPLAWVLGEGSVADLRLAFGPSALPLPAADARALATEEAAEAETNAAENTLAPQGDAPAESGSQTPETGHNDQGQSDG
ncbi:DUF6519 domain-containing protein [Streptomyces sp. NPDC014894]|uniref:DUF6519 domain-containing protein n=1 Tax=unclassified Streptomyces TaxID=2593676 RepID=UPI0036FDE5DC